jgi:hypothetical protein
MIASGESLAHILALWRFQPTWVAYVPAEGWRMQLQSLSSQFFRVRNTIQALSDTDTGTRQRRERDRPHADACAGE